jgi:integrase/recombinase XerD
MRDARIGFDQLVQDFFLRRLIDQRGASARTVESYRDAFELLFGFIETRDAKSPSALTVDDLDLLGPPVFGSCDKFQAAVPSRALAV